jgi:hypothetical protein
VEFDEKNPRHRNSNGYVSTFRTCGISVLFMQKLRNPALGSGNEKFNSHLTNSDFQILGNIRARFGGTAITKYIILKKF